MEKADSTKSFKYKVLKWLNSKGDNDVTWCDLVTFDDIGKTSSFWNERRNRSIYTINVPWMGLQFDINDLGIIAGFSFQYSCFYYFISLAFDIRISRNCLQLFQNKFSTR